MLSISSTRVIRRISTIMRNIEIKAAINDPNAVKSKAEELSGSKPTIIQQVDTFYVVPNGRLKLREFSNGTGELIYYERPDTKGPKLSNYLKTQFNSETACREIDNILCKIHGHLGVVRKTRLLYIIGQSRVHIDDVSELGNFMEIEVVLKDDQDIQVGEEISNDLMAKFGIAPDNLISTAYIDLLSQKAKNQG